MLWCRIWHNRSTTASCLSSFTSCIRLGNALTTTENHALAARNRKALIPTPTTPYTRENHPRHVFATGAHSTTFQHVFSKWCSHPLAIVTWEDRFPLSQNFRVKPVEMQIVREGEMEILRTKQTTLFSVSTDRNGNCLCTNVCPLAQSFRHHVRFSDLPMRLKVWTE